MKDTYMDIVPHARAIKSGVVTTPNINMRSTAYSDLHKNKNKKNMHKSEIYQVTTRISIVYLLKQIYTYSIKYAYSMMGHVCSKPPAQRMALSYWECRWDPPRSFQMDGPRQG